MDHEAALLSAGKLAQVAGEHADEGERLRRLAAPVAEAMIDSSLGRLVAPSALGGGAAHPATMVAVIETVARADPSAGWCLGIGMGSNYLSGLVPRSAAATLFGDLDRLGCGPFAPTGRAVIQGDNTVCVSGRWAFTSNCHQRGVMACGVTRSDNDTPAPGADGPPRFELAFLTGEQYDILETWDTVGMRATGSHDTVASNVVMSDDRFAGLFDPSWSDDPLFRLRSFDVLGPCLSPVTLGIGQAALDLVVQAAHEDRRSGARPSLPNDVVMQAEYGRADAQLRSARLLLADALDASWGHAERGDTPPREASALIGLANLAAVAAATRAIDTAARVLGTASIREGAPLERLRRDLDTARQHIIFAPAVEAPLGRQLAGVLTVAPPLLPPPS